MLEYIKITNRNDLYGLRHIARYFVDTKTKLLYICKRNILGAKTTYRYRKVDGEDILQTAYLERNKKHKYQNFSGDFAALYKTKHLYALVQPHNDITADILIRIKTELDCQEFDSLIDYLINNKISKITYDELFYTMNFKQYKQIHNHYLSWYLE